MLHTVNRRPLSTLPPDMNPTYLLALIEQRQSEARAIAHAALIEQFLSDFDAAVSAQLADASLPQSVRDCIRSTFRS